MRNTFIFIREWACVPHTRGGQRTTGGGCVCVLGVDVRSSGLAKKCLYPPSPLAIPRDIFKSINWISLKHIEMRCPRTWPECKRLMPTIDEGKEAKQMFSWITGRDIN